MFYFKDMAYLIRVGEKPTYYAGKEESLFVDQAAEAKEYATKKEADKDCKEIAETLGYSTLNVVKSDEAPSAEIASAEVTEGEEVVSVVDESLSAEDLRRLNS